MITADAPTTERGGEPMSGHGSGRGQASTRPALPHVPRLYANPVHAAIAAPTAGWFHRGVAVGWGRNDSGHGRNRRTRRPIDQYSVHRPRAEHKGAARKLDLMLSRLDLRDTSLKALERFGESGQHLKITHRLAARDGIPQLRHRCCRLHQALLLEIGNLGVDLAYPVLVLRHAAEHTARRRLPEGASRV